MKGEITVEQEFTVGTETVIDSRCQWSDFGVVFEDDQQTGYFYGLDLSGEDMLILDAVHIYNVSNVTDKDIPSTVQIMWSEDGLKSALFINKYPHAVFDFEAKRAYCRTDFPPPREDWSQEGQEWDDTALELFK
ncbi:MAG TPA: DUF2251 domain-containing protein [Planctomycetota bacterium]|nr:DUF2251 domain-containing protein [Planctomycetota bacterium]